MLRVPQLRISHLHLFHLYFLRARCSLSRKVLHILVDAHTIGVVQFQPDSHLFLSSTIGKLYAYRHILVVACGDIQRMALQVQL